MKDSSISYDLAHQHQQQHSWNHQPRQHQNHSNMIYQNQANSQTPGQQSQRSIVGTQHHNDPPLGQYHQQLQSSSHHGGAPTYYQQAHIYQPPYQAHNQDASASQQQQSQQQQSQQQPRSQQHISTDHHHHHQSPAGPGQNSSVGAVANVHHPQSNTGNQTAAINHPGWSPGLGPQTHHAVVTGHSTMAYMAHHYQSHNNTVNDHHRNNNGSLSSQNLNPGHQGSTFAVDPLYNSAAAAYGYNNYNTAFFQSSNNGQHSQSGHANQSTMSNFWNHNQPGQHQRGGITQPIGSQANVQTRQAIVSEQGASFIHDPRMYYGRHYGQNLQNINQTQHQSQTQSQSDVLHHRMNTLPHLQQIFPHHDQHVHQIPPQSNAVAQPTSLTNLPTGSTPTSSTNLTSEPSSITSSQPPVTQPPTANGNSTSDTGSVHQQRPRTINNNMKNSQMGPEKTKPSEESTKSSTQIQSKVDNDKLVASVQSTISSDNVNVTNKESSNTAQQQESSSESANLKNYPSQNVIRADYKQQFSRTKQHQEPSSIQNQGRTIFRPPQDDRLKQQHTVETSKKSNADRDFRLGPDSNHKSNHPETNQNNLNEKNTPIEESMASLSVTPRKTTWASIASQPAKVIQPKSLKSKIAGSGSSLSSAKHLAVVSIDAGSEPKNGINPAIKSSVSAATTSIQRSSVPPPIAKLPAVAASLKLGLLGDSLGENAKISWPAVNASANLNNNSSKDKEHSNIIRKSSDIDTIIELDNRMARDHDDIDKDHEEDHNHNHNQDYNSKIAEALNEPIRESWSRRNEQYKTGQRELDMDMNSDYRDDISDNLSSRQEYRNSSNQPVLNNIFRDKDDHYRDRDRDRMIIKRDRNGPMTDRGKPMRGADNYSHPPRFSQPNRYEPRNLTRNQDNDFGHPPFRDRNNRDRKNSRGSNSPSSARPPSPKPELKIADYMNELNYNPKTFSLELKDARYFIIKSYSGDDIYRSIKYSIWCSTNHGNKKLDDAFKQQQSKDGPIYLFFSVNGSGHFCGVAQMTSAVDFDSSTGVWALSKWQGQFSIKWIYVKDVPNNALRHITLENNEDKPVTNSRDTQEVPTEKGQAVLKIIHHYTNITSMFDQFLHYERRQEEDRLKRLNQVPSEHNQDHGRLNDEREHRSGDRPSRPSFGGRPYMNPRDRNDFHGNHRPGPRIGQRPSGRPMMDPKTNYRENVTGRVELTQ